MINFSPMAEMIKSVFSKILTILSSSLYAEIIIISFIAIFYATSQVRNSMSCLLMYFFFKVNLVK